MSEQHTSQKYSVNTPNIELSAIMRVVSVPEMRFTPSGQQVLNLRAVASRSFQQEAVWKEKNAFFKLTAWRETAERINNMNLTPGDVILVTFSMADIEAEAYMPKNAEADGTIKPRASLTLSVNGLRWVAKKNAAAHTETPETETPVELAPEEIPF